MAFFLTSRYTSGMLSLILLAGGTGSRFGGETPKQFLNLAGKSLALHSFHTLTMAPFVTEVIIVCPPSHRHLFETHLPIHFASPGARRQDSVQNGLAFASGKWVAIHDGARPLVSLEAFEELYQAAKKEGAASLGMPVTSTIKERQEGRLKTLDRSHLWEIQTPQIMGREELLKGYRELNGAEVTDDLSVLERMGHAPALIEGGAENLKVTRPIDLAVVETILEGRYAEV